MEEHKILEIIGNNIKIARTLKGYTQEELSEKMEKQISPKFVSMIERAESGLSLKSIVDICTTLDIEPNTLFNGIINYNDDKDKYITNQLSALSSEDKEFLINVIEYIIKRGSK